MQVVLVNELPSGVKTRTRTESEERFMKRDFHLRSLLLNALEGKYVKMVLGCDTSKIWERLLAFYQKKSEADIITSQNEFFSLQMERDEAMADNIARGELLFNQAVDSGVTWFNDSTLTSTLLAGLPKIYYTFVSNWSNNQPSDKRTITHLVARLIAEEQLIQNIDNQK